MAGGRRRAPPRDGGCRRRRRGSGSGICSDAIGLVGIISTSTNTRTTTTRSGNGSCGRCLFIKVLDNFGKLTVGPLLQCWVVVSRERRRRRHGPRSKECKMSIGGARGGGMMDNLCWD